MQFAITIFISAYLLFQVQPLIARYILPWFGGSPAVWSTCMLFFQVGLLLGYAYAHLISRYLNTHKQVIVHSILLALSLLVLPITPDDSLKPDNVDSPSLDIIVLLLSTVGIPYMIVSSTGPLLQQWFAQKYPDKSPYRLYSLSNLGSLLGLLTYPFIIEPNLGLNTQTISWSIGYCIFIVACGWTGVSLYRYAQSASPASATTDAGPVQDEQSMRPLDPLLWVALSACGSVLLLAATNFICQDVAVIPFFWVLPLSLYLITFIIAFDSPRWYIRWIWIPALVVIVPVIFQMLDAHYNYEDSELINQIVIYLGGMFLAVMVCHGEIARLKPPTKNITFFYLMISLGGALGGCFVTFVAPNIFEDFWEWPVGLSLAIMLAGISIIRQPGFDIPKVITKTFGFTPSAKDNLAESNAESTLHSKYVKPFAIACGLMMMGHSTYFGMKIPKLQDSFSDGVISTSRNFYGVLRVVQDFIGEPEYRLGLFHGQIKHGIQIQDPSLKREPTAYYSTYSGVGVAIRNHTKRLNEESLKVGVVGLGVGTIGTYLKENDEFVYYEIDPDVERLARKYFTYLNDGGDNVEVVLGDGRISLEKELKQEGSRKFDIIVVDAFSGDAIPTHLLTVEAFELYRQHLAEDGILAIHITNLYLNLEPLLYNIGKTVNMETVLIEEDRDPSKGVSWSSWVLLSNNQEFMSNPSVTSYIADWGSDVSEQNTLWTDDYSNLVQLLSD